MGDDARSTTIKLATEPLAHLGKDGRGHLLIDHLHDVGDLAEKFGAVFGAGAHARLAGRWHDLGKYGAEFQVRIRTENGFEAHIEPEDVETSGQKDHSSAGAVLAAGRGAGHLAFAIAGHHAGLPNRSDLKQRLEHKKTKLDEAIKGGATAELRAEAVPALPPRFIEKGLSRAEHDGRARRLEFWTRMVFSALCDADFLDTERFYDSSRSEGRAVDVPLKTLSDALDGHLTTLETKARTLGATEVDRVRQEVREACLDAAEMSPGLFTLTVPTGGGKTLASMAFALRHARVHGLDRVIVVIPYTSIIEQNADVYREAFGPTLRDAVIEHHSATDPRSETALNRLASENWDAPVVVTTTAQLFDSMFANRPGRCRKLHRLARSVIVLDEAQTLPPALLPSILDGLQTLTDDFGSSVVLCTATQPALGHREALPCGLSGTREIVPSGINAFGRLRRVEVTWPSEPRLATTWESLSAEIARELDVLAIVHQRKDARELCAAVDALTATTATLHLSALMCPEHRSKVLKDIKSLREKKIAVRLISTQLVEAGVNLDFPVVYRALAGMDAMAQAAGRCNREGRMVDRLGSLRLFRAPSPPPMGVLRSALDVTLGMLTGEAPPDLFAPETYERYFKRLYHSLQVTRDPKGLQAMRETLRFKDLAEAFEFIDDSWSAPVVVPYGESAHWVKELEAYGPSRLRMRRLQRFMVSVPRRVREKWISSGRARWTGGLAVDTVAVVSDLFSGAYDGDRFGLDVARLSEGVADAELLVV